MSTGAGKVNKKGLTAFQVAATYIGTVVGAGFASGQEIFQFFGHFGLAGFWALLLATVLFVFFGLVILDLGRKLEADSHLPVIHAAGGKWVGTLVDYVITFFLFGAFTAMAAGAGALFEEQFGLSPLLGNGLLIVTTLATVMIGLSGVINAISFVVPVLLASVIGISIATLASTGWNFSGLEAAAPGKPPVPFWPLSAIVYVSYNLVVAVAVLAPLGKRAHNHRINVRGAVWGGIGLGIGAIAIFLALLVNLPKAATFDIPMLYVSGRLLPWAPVVYSLVLFAEIYTTAVGSLYGFAVRLAKPDTPRLRWITVGSGLAAFIASQFGFTTLVRVLYPAVGVAGLAMLGGLTWGVLRERILPAVSFKKKSGAKK